MNVCVESGGVGLLRALVWSFVVFFLVVVVGLERRRGTVVGLMMVVLWMLLGLVVLLTGQRGRREARNGPGYGGCRRGS